MAQPTQEYNQHQTPTTTTSPPPLPAGLWPFEICSSSSQSTGLLVPMFPSPEGSTYKNFLAAQNGVEGACFLVAECLSPDRHRGDFWPNQLLAV